MSTKKKHSTIYMEQETWDALVIQASKENRTVSNLVETLCKNYIGGIKK